MIHMLNSAKPSQFDELFSNWILANKIGRKSPQLFSCANYQSDWFFSSLYKKIRSRLTDVRIKMMCRVERATLVAQWRPREWWWSATPTTQPSVRDLNLTDKHDILVSSTNIWKVRQFFLTKNLQFENNSSNWLGFALLRIWMMRFDEFF